MSQSEIIKAFDTYIKKSGCQYYNQIYIGITNDPEKRIFSDHNVQKDNQWWIYANADNEEIARNVEKHYLEFGMKGNKGGGTGTGDCRFVYCYVITNTTKE